MPAPIGVVLTSMDEFVDVEAVLGCLGELVAISDLKDENPAIPLHSK